MISPAFSHILLGLIVAISILLMLIRPGDIPEVYWVGGGALLLIVLRLIPIDLAGKAAVEGSDVYLFLIGMMLLSELAREQGVFDWLSSAALKGAQGQPQRRSEEIGSRRHCGSQLCWRHASSLASPCGV